MTKQVQRRRGTATQHTGFTGAEGEISVNTTNKSVHIHDGTTAGGVEAARADLNNVTTANTASKLSGGTVSSLTVTSADINGGTIDGTTIGGASAGAGTFTNLTATGTTTLAGASTSADITFGDNDKAIFGDGSDLQIYHSGVNSFIDEAGVGSLYLRANNLLLQKYTGETYLQAINDGAVTLYYDNSSKLATTSTGIDVTGTVTADGLTVDGGTSSLKNTSTSPLTLISGLIGDNQALVFQRDGGAVGGSIEYQQGPLGFNIGTDTSHDFRLKTGGTQRLNISNGVSTEGDIAFYEDTGTTPKLYWDASAESLGIGTSSPENKLHVYDGSMLLEASSGTGNAWTFYKNPDKTYLVGIRGSSNDALSFFDLTADAERMRIDSSGNLLVGTTNSAVFVSNTDTGSVSLADGRLGATASGQEPLNLNRLSSDGDIVKFRKDGSTVGSIGTKSSGLVVGNTTANSALRFTANSITAFDPITQTDTGADGDTSLGNSAVRFKDLYLSGGVYLGGTGSANKLDDYEEGTWTPTDQSGAGLSLTVTTATYAKIGNMVYVSAEVLFPSTGSGAQIIIGDMPFTSQSGGSWGGLLRYTNSGEVTPCITVNPGTNNTRWYVTTGGGFTNAQASGHRLDFVAIYLT